MSYLLKRTKKSCLKLLRKISTTKQLFAQKLEEDELSTCHVPAPTTNKFYQNTELATEATMMADFETALEAKQNTTQQQNANDTVQFSENSEQQLNIDEQHNRKNNKNNHNNNQNSNTPNHGQNNAIIQGLTCKFFLGANGYEFQRLQQLRSDAASEIFEDEQQPTQQERFSMEDRHNLSAAEEEFQNVNFEKMQCRRNVRYLRHTPSNSSLELNSDDYGFFNKNNNNNNNINLNTDFDGYQQLLMTNSLKWDINGNSLEYNNDKFINDSDCDYDEMSFVLNACKNINDEEAHLNDFDSKWNRLNDKRLSQLSGVNINQNNNNNNSQRSSHQSSSCTLETWLDEHEHEQQEFELELSVLNEKILQNPA